MFCGGAKANTVVEVAVVAKKRNRVLRGVIMMLAWYAVAAVAVVELVYVVVNKMSERALRSGRVR